MGEVKACLASTQSTNTVCLEGELSPIPEDRSAADYLKVGGTRYDLVLQGPGNKLYHFAAKQDKNALRFSLEFALHELQKYQQPTVVIDNSQYTVLDQDHVQLPRSPVKKTRAVPYCYSNIGDAVLIEGTKDMYRVPCRDAAGRFLEWSTAKITGKIFTPQF